MTAPTSAPAPAPAPRAGLVLLACLIPALAALAAAVAVRLPVPVNDDWIYVQGLAAWHAGTFGLAELVKANNQTIAVFPKLIMLPLLGLDGWNALTAPLVNWTLLAGMAGLLASIAMRSGSTDGRARVPAAALLVALAVLFSLPQLWSLRWPIQINHYLSLLAVAGGFWLLVAVPVGRLSATRLLGVAGLGLVASFSYANGPLFWGLAWLCLAWLAARKRVSWLWPAVLLVLAALVAWAYLHQVQGAGETLGAFQARPGNMARGVLVFLGSGLISGVTDNYGLMAALGGLSLVVLAVLFAASLEQAGRFAPVRLFCLLCCAYVLGSGVLAALGRSHHGMFAMAAERYATFVLFYWACLVLWAGSFLRPGSRPSPFAVPATIAGALLLVAVAAASAASFANAVTFRQEVEFQVPKLAAGWGFDDYGRVFPVANFANKNKVMLHELHLGPFHGEPDWPDLTFVAPSHVVTTDRTHPGQVLRGWAADVESASPGNPMWLVLVDGQGRRALVPAKPENRPDVAIALGKTELADSGFVLDESVCEALAPHGGTLRLKELRWPRDAESYFRAPADQLVCPAGRP